MHPYKRLFLFLIFALAGAGYFGAFSQLDIYPGLKGYLTLVPLQIGALIYCCIYSKNHLDMSE